MSNEAIAHRLAPYGKIDSHQFSVMQNHPGTCIYNGNRTFVFTPLRKHIPSFMQFGKFLLHIKYPGQPSTCRKCHLHDHEAKNCPNVVCYNCDDVGHTCKECPANEKCLICREEDHRAYHCPFSWRNRSPPDDHKKDDDPVDFPPPRPASADPPTVIPVSPDPPSPPAVDTQPPSPADSIGSSSSSSSSSTSPSSSQSSSSSSALPSQSLPSQATVATILDSTLAAAVSDVELAGAVNTVPVTNAADVSASHASTVVSSDVGVPVPDTCVSPTSHLCVLNFLLRPHLHRFPLLLLLNLSLLRLLLMLHL